MNSPKRYVYNQTAIGSTDDPYVDLVIAILRQAVQDAIAPPPRSHRYQYMQEHATQHQEAAWRFLRNEGDDLSLMCAWVGCDYVVLQRKITKMTGVSLQEEKTP